MVEKYIKYNGDYTKVLSCDQCKAGIVNLKDVFTTDYYSIFYR